MDASTGWAVGLEVEYGARYMLFDARRRTSAHKLRSAECYCSRATLDELLSDEVMAPVLRSAGYDPDKSREMMTKIAWNLITLSEGGKAGLIC